MDITNRVLAIKTPSRVEPGEIVSGSGATCISVQVLKYNQTRLSLPVDLTPFYLTAK